MSDDMFYARVCQERDALRAELAAAKDRGDGLYLGLRRTLEALGGVAKPGVSEAFLILGVPGEAAALKRVNTALAADNARLREALETIDRELSDIAESKQEEIRNDLTAGESYGWTAAYEVVGPIVLSALTATPAQSLASHDAAVKVEVLREVVGKLAEMCKKLERTRTHPITWEACEEWILAEADRIEKEGA